MIAQNNIVVAITARGKLDRDFWWQAVDALNSFNIVMDNITAPEFSDINMGGIYLVHHLNKGYVTQELLNYFKNTMCINQAILNSKFKKACEGKWYNDAYLIDNTLTKC